MTSEKSKQIKLGVDWHPEQWPEDNWPSEIEKMVECGIKVVRLAEFTWSYTQPSKNEWNWGWLDQVIQLISDAGLEYILCTPSACPPPWMVKEDPSIFPVNESGLRSVLHGRRYYTPHHEGYKEASAAFAKKMAGRYGDHEALLGFQIDNELGSGVVDCGPLAKSSFQDWLKSRFGTLENLNEKLFLKFWGQSYTSWDQIEPAEKNRSQKGLLIEWKRFVSETWAQFCKAQVDAIRSVCSEKPITTNFFQIHWNMRLNWPEFMHQANLDVFSFDNYSRSEAEDHFSQDLARSISNPYWILEQRCASPQAMYLWPSEGPSLSQGVENATAGGAELATFFCWRQPLGGIEQNHGAILDHTGERGSVFEELKALERPCVVEHSSKDKVGCLFRWEDAWSAGEKLYQQFQRDILHPAICKHSNSVEYLNDHHQLSSFRGNLLLLPMAILHCEQLEKEILEFVNRGGTVIGFPLLFSKDRWDKYRDERFPKSYEHVFGVEVRRYISIQKDNQVTSSLKGQKVGTQFFHRIADVVPNNETEILGRYTDGPICNSPAITISKFESKGIAAMVTGYPASHQDFDRLMESIKTSKQFPKSFLV